MPGLNGFEVLAELAADTRPSIVFVTAWDQYALQAFDVNAVDYLVKPVEEDKLARAIGRLRERSPSEGMTRLAAVVRKPVRRIVGKHLHKLQMLPVETVEAFIAEGELVFALTAEGRFLVERTLAKDPGSMRSRS
jgi:DNA-binding LytR/AlgR family response regulator